MRSLTSRIPRSPGQALDAATGAGEIALVEELPRNSTGKVVKRELVGDARGNQA